MRLHAVRGAGLRQVFLDENGTGASCSFREAVKAINTSASFGGCTFVSGDSLVSLPAGTYPITSAPPTPSIQVSVAMHIQGAGPELTFSCRANVVGVLLSITDTLFRHNSVLGNDANLGGAIYNQGCSLTLANTTFDSNSLGDADVDLMQGGGLASLSVASVANSVQLTNVTFFGNRAGDSAMSSFGQSGGVAFQDATSGSQTVTLTNVTFAGNSAILSGDDLYTDGSSTINVKNVLFGSHQPCAGILGLSSGGGNLDTDFSCNLGGPGDQVEEDPGDEAALADHGGTTPTLALRHGSPAIDAGINTGCPATDQRGATRPQDGEGNGTATCDTGAFELVVIFRDGFESGDTSAWTVTVP